MKIKAKVFPPLPSTCLIFWCKQVLESPSVCAIDHVLNMINMKTSPLFLVYLSLDILLHFGLAFASSLVCSSSSPLHHLSSLCHPPGRPTGLHNHQHFIPFTTPLVLYSH